MRLRLLIKFLGCDIKSVFNPAMINFASALLKSGKFHFIALKNSLFGPEVTFALEQN